MTPKTRILELRAKGLVYREIAEQLGMSVNTVKSICNRNKGVCKNCGTALVGRKEKIFCSGKCRLQWWYAHSTNRPLREGVHGVPQQGEKVLLAYLLHPGAVWG